MDYRSLNPQGTGGTLTILEQLEKSREEKIKSGWSRQVSAGFIAADITEAAYCHQPRINRIEITYSGQKQNFYIADLNLRETEELIKYVKQ